MAEPVQPVASGPDLDAIHRQAHTFLVAEQFAEAEALLRPVLAKGSGPIVLWRQLVHAIRAQGQVLEAARICDMIVRTLPGDMSARFDLAELLLLQGEFDRGWREYRFRYKMDHTTMICRHVQKPRWEGESLRGKTLLIHDEQGYGDTFQFLRMVPWAQARSGARVILEVNVDAYELARRGTGFDDIIKRGDLPPAFDVHCELMSLPMAMGLKMADLPGEMPYLRPDPARVEKWRARLADLPRPLVGLVWAGRPTHTNDKRRSLSLDHLAPLAASGVTFVAVQKGPAAVQALTPPAGMKVVSLSDEIQDFDDTAAILEVLDVLLSVDSSPVHLAGALGRPAWVMLPFMPDWRWLMGRSDTPWYPSVRLFRQPAHGDWAGVMREVGAALQVLRQEAA